jgi:SAM-dependent methyltransferase
MAGGIDGVRVSSHLQDLYADAYTGPNAWREVGARAKARNIVDLCEPPLSLLDVGAGDGSVLVELDRLGFGERHRALDISPSAIATIRARGLSRLTGADVFDGYALPSTETFDLVIASHVLEHVEHERVFLKGLGAVGRAVFIEVPLEDTVRVRRNVHNTIGHVNFYNRHTLFALLSSAGLRVLRFKISEPALALEAYARSRGIAGVKWSTRVLAHRLAGGVAERLLTYHCSVLCVPAGAPG